MLGDEGSERGRTPWVGDRDQVANGDTAVAGVILPRIGALEDGLSDSATRSERLGGRRRIGKRQTVTGVEATAMSNLSLVMGDDGDEMIDRLRGRSRRRVVGTGFLVFLLLGGGAATALWRLSLSRQVVGADTREGGAAPLVEPVAGPEPPAAAPHRATSPGRAEARTRVQPRNDLPQSAEAAAAAAANREATREAEKRAARERRWSLPSNELDTLPAPRLPAPAPPPPAPPAQQSPPARPAQNEEAVAPPPVGEIPTTPTEQKEPAGVREPVPAEPRPNEEPAVEPKPVQPQWRAPPRPEPPPQETKPEPTP